VSQNHHSHEPLYSKITKFSNIRQKDKEEKQRLMKHFKNTKRDKKKSTPACSSWRSASSKLYREGKRKNQSWFFFWSWQFENDHFFKNLLELKTREKVWVLLHPWI